MVTWECDISFDRAEEQNLRTRIKKRSYKIKGKIIPRYTPNPQITSYTFYVRTPRGKFHETQLIDVFEKIHATKTQKNWITEINESKWDKFLDFLKESCAEALAVYAGGFPLLFGTILHINGYMPLTNDHELPHLISMLQLHDWGIMALLAGFPSLAHLLYRQKEYRKRYSTKK